MATRTKLCLAMIVKNEEKFIVSCIESVIPYIDYWVIIDSESEDETGELIKNYMGGAGIPGEFIQYTNYGPFRGDEKRTFMLEHAKDKADYIIMLDADNTLEITGLKDPFFDLDEDAYFVKKRMGIIEFPVVSILRGDYDWKFTGIIHEYPERCDNEKWSTEILEGCIIHEAVKDLAAGSTAPRARDPKHYYEHALLLETEMLKNKDLPQHLINRYIFYTANSYNDCGFLDRALEIYRNRVAYGGFPEEVFYSLYKIALIKQVKNAPVQEVTLAAMAAWNYRPERWEAAMLLMELLISQGLINAALAIGNMSKDLSTNDMLFIEYDVYNHSFLQLLTDLEKKVALSC